LAKSLEKLFEMLTPFQITNCYFMTTATITLEPNIEQPLPPADALIADTALEHHLMIVTRNIRDFDRSGVEIVNPFDEI
jgi:predicted nucleic acid-binding protein